MPFSIKAAAVMTSAIVPSTSFAWMATFRSVGAEKDLMETFIPSLSK